jgi:hypothetical protein
MLVLSSDDYEAITINNAADLAGAAGISRELEAGTWTATVTAYRTAAGSGEYAAARGSETITVAPGEPTPATVRLAPLPAEVAVKGIFSYTLSFPEGAQAFLQFDGEDPVALESGEEFSTEKNPGYYTLYVSVTRGSLQAGLLEKAHIYAGLVSKEAREFTDADFVQALHFKGEIALLH